MESEATRSVIQNINNDVHVCQEMEKREGAGLEVLGPH